MKIVLAVVAAVLLFGYASSGGPVRNPDGTIDAGKTLERSAQAGGEVAGQGLDDVGNSFGKGVGSAVSSSDLAKVAVAGGAAAGVVKYGPKLTRPTVQAPKPVTVPALTPTTQPPKRRTGWCTDLLTGSVQPCDPVKKPAATPDSAPATTSTTVRQNPMSSGGFTVPTMGPLPTWKPCLATPGVLVDC